MFGLIVSDPACNAQRRRQLRTLLHSLDLPLSAFTEEPTSLFPAELPRAAFLRRASWALLIPGQALPLDALLAHLSAADPLPGNVLRRYLFLRWSLMPYLRPGRRVAWLDGAFLLGDDLLVVPVTPEDTADAPLPPGLWTELNGTVHERRLRCVRGWNELPVLVRENTLLPVSMNGQSLTQTASDDADRLTLHWFQPQGEAECVLADGSRYHVQRAGGQIDVHADTLKPFHLIVHQDGVETLIK